MTRHSTPPARDPVETGHRGGAAQLACLGLAAAALGGCNAVQSALHPAGDDAALLLSLTWLMSVGGGAIFVLVMVLLALAIWVRPPWLRRRSTVVALGIVFPTTVLTLLLGYGLLVLRSTNAPASGDALTIEITGEQYWWRVRYPADGDRPGFATANEVQVPVGRPVRLVLDAADVIHSVWIPSFAGKMDMIPGRRTLMQFTPERPGTYRGICAEFCGEQHARMMFDVVALPPAEFDAWREAQARAATEPASDFLRRGREIFARSGCGSCHAVRGAGFSGELGPDLTHVGSRRSIGAGLFPNNAGTLGGWIADVQGLKPGARMPSYGSLAGEELRALAGYLEQLK
ncbi:cytochrome c oxidase subunit II [Enterovirga aerilata]|uniref:Cytochrome aa3 subunit 2 n=1 Tax=Enterovirga aerilata TaxID=2730920 RepID=A0A849IMM7_9HYPH|nr:cytochrome c oxidase subunit II [Enterovirga sp. DB1703]NNM75193.1 cytochrome c oxidase subunit II [Enterovirga sp. DB1703]